MISNNAPLCSGEELILTGTEYIGGIYTWYDPAGNVIGGGKDLSITNIQSSQAGTYGLKL